MQVTPKSRATCTVYSFIIVTRCIWNRVCITKYACHKSFMFNTYSSICNLLFIFTDSWTISLEERLNTCLVTTNYISVYLINLYCIDQFFIETPDFKDFNILILFVILIIYVNCYDISSHVFVCHKHGKKKPWASWRWPRNEAKTFWSNN